MNDSVFLVKSTHTAIPAHGFTILAKVDIDGVCRNIPYTNEYKLQGPGAGAARKGTLDTEHFVQP